MFTNYKMQFYHLAYLQIKAFTFVSLNTMSMADDNLLIAYFRIRGVVLRKTNNCLPI